MNDNPWARAAIARLRANERGKIVPDESPVVPSLEEQKAFVIRHFDDFVNGRDLSAIERNMSDDFLDHDGPRGESANREIDRAMMAAMHERFPDLHVTVLDAIAEGDKVMVRKTATDRDGRRMEFHGFVLWRIASAKIVERWATVTPLHELAADGLTW